MTHAAPEITAQAYTAKRDIHARECPWITRLMFLQGDVVYEYQGHTYGCIGPGGIAVTDKPGEGPFYELPREALTLGEIKY